jgi:small subunit ribosomal protein S3
MAQTTNAIVFRLGIKNNEWNSRYFEKSKEEFTLYNYQNIQIQNYLKQYLNKYGLILHRTRFSLNHTNLHIFVSYITTKKSIFLLKKSKKKGFLDVKFRRRRKKKRLTKEVLEKRLLEKKKKKKKKLTESEKIELKEAKRQKKLLKLLAQKEREFRAEQLKEQRIIDREKLKKRYLKWRLKQYIKKHNIFIRRKKRRFKRRKIKFSPNISIMSRVCKKKPVKAYLLNKRIRLKRTRIGWFYKQKEIRWAKIYNFKLRRVKIVRKFKKKKYKTNYKTNEKLRKSSFLEELLESLSIFTKNKLHIYITFQNLNRGLSIELTKSEKFYFKKIVYLLKRYSKDKFFRESLHIIYITIKIKNSAQLLASFLAKQLPLLKRHNYFLVFLKRILPLFISLESSKIKGVKILISGRFNGAPRAKSRLITAGSTPILTISNPIDYYETTSYTKNGTFGIKIWISPKS